MFGRMRQALRRRRKDWEDTCTRCGLCCYEKDISGNGAVFIDLDRPCRFLDPATRACTVYDRRFRVCRDCRKVRMYHALFSRYMPPECGYVRRYRKWWGVLLPPPVYRKR